MSIVDALKRDVAFHMACFVELNWSALSAGHGRITALGCDESGVTFIVADVGVIDHAQLERIWGQWTMAEYEVDSRVLIFSESGFSPRATNAADEMDMAIYDLGPDGAPRALTREAGLVERRLRREHAAGVF